jgi:hypothetical protein
LRAPAPLSSSIVPAARPERVTATAHRGQSIVMWLRSSLRGYSLMVTLEGSISKSPQVWQLALTFTAFSYAVCAR